jgi:hypothetical protein
LTERGSLNEIMRRNFVSHTSMDRSVESHRRQGFESPWGRQNNTMIVGCREEPTSLFWLTPAVQGPQRVPGGSFRGGLCLCLSLRGRRGVSWISLLGETSAMPKPSFQRLCEHVDACSLPRTHPKTLPHQELIIPSFSEGKSAIGEVRLDWKCT